MTHLRIKNDKISPAIVDLVAGSLKAGQVMVLPTDTIYGLSCLATEIRAIKKIYHIKKRDSKKPVLVLVSDLAMAKKYAYVSKKQEGLLKYFWSKKSEPTTIILRNKHKLPEELTRRSNGLALRLPKSKFLIKIIEKAGYPLVSTSLNFSGQADIKNLKKLAEYFPKKADRPDLVIDTGRAPLRKPSRIVDLQVAGRAIVIRP
jgi:L-threonylcarbamoyladenylate synthase